jgi:hypothetical protein
MLHGGLQQHSWARLGWWKLGTGVAGLVFGVGIQGVQTSADEATFSDFPYVIYCRYEGIDHAYYFSQLRSDGRAIYITPDRQVGLISIEGVADRIGGERPGSCLDKTLDELRATGQAYDLPR